jgi:hypothetical protein
VKGRVSVTTIERLSVAVPADWVVTPGSKTVEVLVLERGAYSSSGLFHGWAVLPSRIVPSMSVKVEQFFAFTS